MSITKSKDAENFYSESKLDLFLKLDAKVFFYSPEKQIFSKSWIHFQKEMQFVFAAESEKRSQFSWTATLFFIKIIFDAWQDASDEKAHE